MAKLCMCQTGAALDFVTDLKPEICGKRTSSRLPAMLRRTITGLALGTLLIGAAGCGDVFRPPVAAISPVGPAAQPTKYDVVVSDPGNGKPGLFTMVDFSSDTVMNTTSIGIAPKYFILGYSGTEAYVLNGDGSINSFGVSTYLLSNQIQTSTLFSGAGATSLFPGSSYTYITEPYPAGPNPPSVAEAQGSPPSVKQELTVGANPVFIAGNPGSSRIYAISKGANNVTAIQTATNTILNTIPVGTAPVYGVMTSDNNRAFILNSGSNSVSVINVNTNQLDSSPIANPIPVGGGPVWADLYAQGSLLVTANSTGNSVSIISIPLCSIVALPGNPTCDASNPTDAATFGTVLATVPVGTDPTNVSILQDGTRAYVANTNAGNPTGGSVSVVDLTKFTVTKTIPFDGNTSNPDGSTNVNHGPLCHPNFINTSVGTPTGKVYVTCADGQLLTVLETQTDTVRTTINLQGYAVQNRVTAQ